MPTLTLLGYNLRRYSPDDTSPYDAPTTLEIILPPGRTSFTYSVENAATATDLPVVDLDLGELGFILTGGDLPDLPGTIIENNSMVEGGPIGTLRGDETVSLGTVTSHEGTTHVLLSFKLERPDGGSHEFIFQLQGDVFPVDFSGDPSIAELMSNIDTIDEAGGTFSPDAEIRISSLDNARLDAEPDVIIDTGGSEPINGTAGNDFIATSSNALVLGSSGNDTIGMQDHDGSNGFITLDYSALGGGIEADINGLDLSGAVFKGGRSGNPDIGTDRLLNVENVLRAGGTDGGLSIVGTSEFDAFFVSPMGQQWISIRPGDGRDYYGIGGTLAPEDLESLANLRLDMSDGDGIDVNVETGVIADDGFGNSEDISSVRWLGGTFEVFGSRGDDVFQGSNNDESFRSMGGNNMLDGGAGSNRLRYDASQINRVTIDVSVGKATGMLEGGGSFTDSITGFEHLRGSDGRDQVTGEAGMDNLYEGQSGTDTFVHIGGNDAIADFDLATETLIVRLAGLDQAAVDAALSNATDLSPIHFGATNAFSVPQSGAVVDFGSGNTVAFGGLSADDLTGATVQFVDLDAASLVQGTDGDDDLDGTPRDDVILTGNATALVGDVVNGSIGNDTIDLSGNDGVNGFVTIDYSGLTGPATITVNGASNTASVDKVITGADSTMIDVDTLVGVAQPLAAGWVNGGLAIFGTDSGDTFNVTLDDLQWMSIRGGEGVDTYNITTSVGERITTNDAVGALRLDMRFGDGIDVNLATGVIANDGYGNAEQINGNAPIWEISGSGGDDVFVGSDNAESYRYTGGSNTLDGGAGNDRIRYDSAGISDLVVDLAAGTAIGTVDGTAFTDSLSSFEHVRGTSGNDWLAGDNLGGFNILDGRGGADTFVPGAGVTRIDGFTPGVSTLDVARLGVSIADAKAALESASFDGFNTVVSMPRGSTLQFSSLNATQVASIDPVSEDTGGILIEGTPGDEPLNGTDGDDTAIGNGGNDQFDLGAGDDTAFVGEGSASIHAGSGNDTYNFTDILEGWVFIGYGHLTDSSILADGLTVDVDGAANTGSIVKGGLGTDTLVDAENPLFSGWTTGGLSVDGTLGADTFNITLDDLQWMAIRPGDGVDSYDINASASERPDADFSVGALRLDMRGGDGIDIDLSTDEILDDGFGNVEQIEGNAPIWEVWGSEGDDRFVGSDNVESYRYAGGSNNLDAGVGFDRLRYDVAEVASVDIDAENGVVNGTLSGGGTFTDTIAGFQHLRGSNGNDRIAGDSNDNLLEGWGGDDAFVLVGGDDTVDGGDGNDQVFFGVTKDEAAVTSEGAGTHTVVIGSDTITLTSIEELVFEESGLTPPAPSAAAPAWTLGDPHLLTLDGLGYDFHAVGEYVLLQGQSGESVNGFEIQSRMTPAKDDAGADLDDVSVNQAIAMRAANGDAVMIDSNDADPLSVGGTVETIEVGDFLDVGVDRIYRAGDTYTMVFAGDDGTLNDGDTQVAVKVHDGRVDLSVRISDELAGRIEGLLGDGDGDKSNDVAHADGTVLEHPLAFEDLYGGYRDDWRVDDEADSLFTYDAGETLAGFYDPDKPGSVTTVDDFDPADQEAARQAAEDAGLTPGSVNYDNAVLDFLLTGDPGFVESSASEDVAAPETASVAPTLDVGQERVTIQFTVTDRAGDGIEDALVGFSTGASTARSLAEDDGGGLYSLSVGEGASGRIGGSMEFTNTGEIAVGDALEVLRIAVGLDPSWGAAQGLDFVAADVNRDGQVTVGDALEVLRSAVGLESDNAPEWVFLDPDLDVLGVTADNVTYDTGMETGPLETKSLELTGVLLGSLQGAPEA